MKKPLVSAVITTYKRDLTTLKRAIDSVIGQSHQEIELIVVNDNPEEPHLSKRIEELIRGYEQEIEYVVMPKNSGACAARNEGYRRSKGEFIGFLDDDDEWLKQKIELQLEKMNEDVGIVYCDSYIINDKTNKQFLRSETLRTKKFPEGMIIGSLLRDNIIGSCSFPLIRRSVLEDIGVFNEKLPAIQDFELWIRICMHYKAAYVDKPLVKYHVHSGDQISKHFDKRAKGMDMIYKLNSEYFKNNKKLDAAMCRQLVIFHIVNSDYGYAYKMNLKAIAKDPRNLKENFFSTIRLVFRTIIKKRPE